MQLINITLMALAAVKNALPPKTTVPAGYIIIISPTNVQPHKDISNVITMYVAVHVKAATVTWEALTMHSGYTAGEIGALGPGA
jgi:hypothetical protein